MKTSVNKPSTKAVPGLLAISDFRILIDHDLDARFRHWEQRSLAIDPEAAKLIDRLREYMLRGGKRWRPYLTYVGYVGYGGDDLQGILPVATSQELYHGAWLIYDDIIDRDTTRHGGPNMTGVYAKDFELTHDPAEARHLADAMALLAGNMNSTIADDAILGSNVSDELKVKALRLQQATIVELAGGEQLDVLAAAGVIEDVTRAKLLTICRYKAANYSFETPLKLGALLAGASNDELEAISRFALPLGIAFQLRDDILGLFGDEEATGKSALSDLREGKRTLLVLEALERLQRAERADFLAILGDPEASVEQLTRARSLIEDCGALEAVEQLTQSQADEALHYLGLLSISQPAAEALRGLTQRTINRNA